MYMYCTVLATLWSIMSKSFDYPFSSTSFHNLLRYGTYSLDPFCWSVRSLNLNTLWGRPDGIKFNYLSIFLDFPANGGFAKEVVEEFHWAFIGSLATCVCTIHTQSSNRGISPSFWPTIHLTYLNLFFWMTYKWLQKHPTDPVTNMKPQYPSHSVP